MKKFLPYILIVFTLVNFLAPVSIGLSEKNRVVVEKKEASAADVCEFTGATFSTTGGVSVTRPESVTLNVTTKYCTNKIFSGYLQEKDNLFNNYVIKIPNQIVVKDDFSIKFTTGETSCDNGICNIVLDLTLKSEDGASTLSTYKSKSTADSADEFVYQCNNITNCNSQIIWAMPSSSTQGTQEAGSFTINFSSEKNSITVSGVGPTLLTTGVLSILSSDTIEIGIYNADGTLVGESVLGEKNPKIFKVKDELLKDSKVNYTKTFSGLNSSTPYSILIKSIFGNFIYLTGENKIDAIYTKDESGRTVVPLPGGITMNSQGFSYQNNSDPMPVCSIMPLTQGTFTGCIAQAIYYVLFVPTSYLFALVGNFFDWTFAYSVNDASYRSGFVVQGWGVVRDFCNMFFIFILLYVAFTTILGTNSGKTKEMIVNVVIIGLLINFSLFATQVIIDASNILARVFYNSNTIVITPNGSTVGQTGLGTTPSDPTGTGIIPLSEALVNKINPQNLIINAKDVNDLSTQSNIGVAKNASNDDSISVGRFIIVTLLATGVNVVGFVVFITVALLFVGRVVMLWIAMILSPIVFFTYMVPAMQNFDTIGWKKWWPETLKLAFLAPVFIFFLYIILKFLQTNLVFIDSTGKHGIQMVIAVMVPFAFIMVLLLQAKKIATGMAGKMGETMAKAGSAVSGLALGAATGGAAMLGRASIGKLGDKLDKSKWVNKMAGGNNLFSKFVGNKLKDTGQKVASKSFDVRNSTLGGMAFKGMDLDSKGKTGGYTKDREDKVKKKQKRAKEIEVNEDEELTQNINALEIDLQKMLNAIDGEFKSIDKQLEDQRQKKLDADSNAPANLGSTTNDFEDSVAEIKRLKEVKKSMKEAKGNTASITAANTTASTDRTAADAATAAAVGAALGSPLANTAQALERIALGSEAIAKATAASAQINGKSIKQIEVIELPEAKNAKEKESRRRTTNYANNTAWFGGRANKEAQHKIIMGSKIDSGTKV